MTALSERIAALIVAQGPISVAQYHDFGAARSRSGLLRHP